MRRFCEHRMADREEFYIRKLDSVNRGLNTFYTDDELVEFARKFKGKKRKKRIKKMFVTDNMYMGDFIKFLSKRRKK